MKKSNLSYAEGFLGIQARAAKDKPLMVFDWDKAAEIIKSNLEKYPNLRAEAGLQGDWEYTGGIIYENKLSVTSDYTYLASNWAIPTLLLFNGEDEVLEVGCYALKDESRFTSESKWDEKSLKILNN